jgi:hypothetical protein
MDSQYILGCAMSMNLVQVQPKLSTSEASQRFGIEAAYTVTLDRASKIQNSSCRYYGEIESSFVLDTSQCRSCRYVISLVLGALFKSIQRSLSIGFLISQAMAGRSALVLKRQLGQLSRSMPLGIQICSYYG